jgi:hypothetical protein
MMFIKLIRERKVIAFGNVDGDLADLFVSWATVALRATGITASNNRGEVVVSIDTDAQSVDSTSASVSTTR